MDYTCLLDIVDEFLFSTADTIAVGPVRLAACRPVDAGHNTRHADAIVDVVARSQDKAMMIAAAHFSKAVAILDYAMFRENGDNGSESSTKPYYVVPRWDALDGYPILPHNNGGGNEAPSNCIRMYQESTPRRGPFNCPRISCSTVAVDVYSHHVPDLIDMVFPTKPSMSKGQKALHLAIFAATDQLHKSIRHDIYTEGRELSLLRAITGLESLFTPLGADSPKATASAVGYGAVFASLACNTRHERLTRWNRVKELYETWGRIVSGSKTDEPTERDVLDARAILADGIESCIASSDAISAVGLQEWITRRRFGCDAMTTVPDCMSLK
jgi:hypothetical protein